MRLQDVYPGTAIPPPGVVLSATACEQHMGKLHQDGGDLHYRRHFLREIRALVVPFVTIELAILVIFSLTDRYWFGTPLSYWIWGLRFAFTLPPVLGLYLNIFRHGSNTWLYRWLCLNALGLGIAVVAIIGIARLIGIDLPWEGLILVMAAIFLASGLLLREATIISAVVLLFYFTVLQLSSAPTHVWMMNSLFLLTTYLMGTLTVFVRDRSNKRILELNQRIAQIATTDRLTGLGNRYQLEQQFENSVKLCRRLGGGMLVTMLDLDFFKWVNDHLGHAEGDRYLCSIANELSSTARRHGDLSIRYGGEEFILILSDVSATVAKTQISRLLGKIQQLGLKNPRCEAKHQTVSAGAVWRSFERDTSIDAEVIFEQMLRQTDRLLYLAKGRGRNRLEFRTASTERSTDVSAK